MNKNLEYFKKIFLIRKFENLLLSLFKLGYIKGTTHTCNGQEATPVICLDDLTKDDCVVSNHRSHGHFLAYSNLVEELLCELLGRDDGICSGLAGSQHIHFKNFYSNGILGNLVPMGVGLALSKKLTKSKGTIFIFVGDGTFGQGVVYESLNIASLKRLSCMFIVENNKIAQTTPIERHLAGDIEKRFNSFNIKTFNANSYDINSLVTVAKKGKKYIKSHKRPCALIINSFRFNAHSKGDDTRNEKYISLIKKTNDPLNFFRKKIKKNDFENIEKKINKYLEKICKKLKLKI
jgi:TPP-dependent pyruvate/acetoin dehydrogenase alpha subunit